MDEEWFFLKSGLEVGPVNSQALIDLARKGRIDFETPVKIGEDGKWHKAMNVEGLFDAEPETEPGKPTEGMPDSTVAPQNSATYLDGPLVCPHCWQHFSHESLLYIAKHSDLRGDPVLGSDKPQRFLPSRFTPRGHAIDSHGMECEDIACPHCHLEIPDTVVKVESLYFSIIGAPSSGKSFFMTAMISRVRKLLSKYFEFSFIDADPAFNFVINDYEQLLFANTNPDSFVTLRKTDLQGSLFSNQLTLDGMIVDLPKPVVYKIEPLSTHSAHAKSFKELTKNIILYDNAGEHFLPGQDSVNNPATKHLIQSNGLIFIFDPSLDADMRLRCDSGDPQLKDTSKIINQSVLLSEMIARIRKNSGMRHGDKYGHPLVVVMSKYDMWDSMLCDKIRDINPWSFDTENMQYYLDYEKVANVSYHLREIILEIKPDIVSAAEAFSDKVFFIPASAIGTSAIEKEFVTKQDGDKSSEGRAYGVKPREIRPVWCETPLLLLLALDGYIPVARIPHPDAVEIDKYKFSKGFVKMILPDSGEMLKLPSVYFGTTLYDHRLDRWLKVPENGESRDSSEIPDGDFWEK